LVWILQKFVNGLYRNFGPGTTGFPKSEGESLMYQILQDLGRFICWFLDEGEISLDSLSSALERYRRLLQITKWYIYKGPGTDYVTLWASETAVLAKKDEDAMGEARCADALFMAGAVKFGAFRLNLHETNPDASLSPVYIDMRVIRSHPEERRIVADEYEKLIRNIPFDVLADVPTAVTPFVAMLADRLGVPMVTPRGNEKTHGSGATIDGAFQPGQRALVIDDLITSADSKLEAIRTLEAGGLVVTDVVVLIDRQQGGVERLQEAGYKVHVKYLISKLLHYYMETGRLEQEKGQQVFKYLGL
ncbi:MAG: hypothetical protein A2672_02285, partial [Candidatus Wildermuthbacteria bacterium RIFCSPHIGHO2_01_FULL_49_22b]